MKIRTRYKGLLIAAMAILGLSSCNKYLDAKPNKSFVIPASIQDAQALNDYYVQENIGSSAGTTSDDNYFVLYSFWNTLDEITQNEYTWDASATTNDVEWRATYTGILNSNVALETLNGMQPDATTFNAYNIAKGGALFLRAFQHYQLVSIYTLQYINATANTDLGIPYKITSDITEKVYRLSLKDTYQAILNDFKAAAAILPVAVTPITRPSKAAAFAALARVYLSMNDYSNAFLYADSALQLNNNLLDYNNYNGTTTTTPFPTLTNQEIVFYSISYGSKTIPYPSWICDTTLYQSYAANDLRQALYYRKNAVPGNYYGFKGGYNPNKYQGPFGGLANDEMYLIRAECAARAGNVNAAMSDLNTLLATRWKTGTFIPFTAVNADDALNQILIERRKELVQRNNLRWTDLKRLNTDPRYAKTLTRVLNGQTYSLPPGDLRYALLIPTSVIQLSGIQQNSR